MQNRDKTTLVSNPPYPLPSPKNEHIMETSKQHASKINTLLLKQHPEPFRQIDTPELHVPFLNLFVFTQSTSTAAVTRNGYGFETAVTCNGYGFETAVTTTWLEKRRPKFCLAEVPAFFGRSPPG